MNPSGIVYNLPMPVMSLRVLSYTKGFGSDIGSVGG